MSTAAERLACLESAAKGSERQRAILGALEDEAPAVRDKAIRLAARHIEPAALSELVADGDNAVRRNAGLAALERQGPYAVPHLVGLLGHRDPELVMFALQSLSRIGFGASGPAILPLLHHTDPNVAQAAIEAVGQLRSREAVPALCALLSGDLWLQLAAIAALGEIGDPGAVKPLMAFVPDSVLAEPAVQALRSIAAPESLEPLLALLVIVRERALRDPLLLALAVIIELHPDPSPLMPRIDGEPAAYLEELLTAAPVDGDADLEEADSLFRAAATLATAAGIERLQPILLARLASDGTAGWIEGFFGRFSEGLTARLPALLEHPDPDVRTGALRAGAVDEADVGRVMAHLGDPQERVRAAACFALGRIELDAVAPLLAERLRRGGPVEQAAAAQALGRLSAEALAELGTCLEPGCPASVMVHALEVLARHPVPALEGRILQLAEERDPEIRLAALKAAVWVSGPRSDVLLLRALADRHQTIQREALELLVRRGGERSVATLIALLGTADSLRFHVIRALGHCRAPGAAAKLRDLYPECGPHEQLQIVWSLLRIRPPWLTEFLRPRLSDTNLEMRRAAAQGLSEAGDENELSLLVPLAEDADWNIRNEAARGLGRLASPEAKAALLSLVRDEESIVAATARASLERLPGDAALLSA
jgi:HEAT repeat protein